ncbi:hypothetical protein BCR35DRAFT_345611, partial [Leucosporidium creatinivorum]
CAHFSFERSTRAKEENNWKHRRLACLRCSRLSSYRSLFFNFCFITLTMSNVCEAAWGHLNIDHELPPLIAETALPAEWHSACKARRDLLGLLVEQPFPKYLTFPGSAAEWEGTIVELVRKAGEQADKQEARFTDGQWIPCNVGTKKDVCKSLTSPSHYLRPFCLLMNNDDVNKMFHNYITVICGKMIRAARTPEQADKIVFLVHRDWFALDPLRRAKGILAARAYFGYIQLAHHVSQPAFPAPPYVAHSLPSLTARQARRSAVSESELRARWA